MTIGRPTAFGSTMAKGHFRAGAPLALRHTSKFSMGVDFADIDHDGCKVDFCVADMLSRDSRERNVNSSYQTRRAAPSATLRVARKFRKMSFSETAATAPLRRSPRMPASPLRSGPGSRCLSTWTWTVGRTCLFRRKTLRTTWMTWMRWRKSAPCDTRTRWLRQKRLAPMGNLWRGAYARSSEPRKITRGTSSRISPHVSHRRLPQRQEI